MELQNHTILAWLLKSWKHPLAERVASPMFTAIRPPGFSTRMHSFHTKSSCLCIRSKAAVGEEYKRSFISPSIKLKQSSHMAIMGYGGEVTIRSMDLSVTAPMSCAFPILIMCSVAIGRIKRLFGKGDSGLKFPLFPGLR